MSSSKSFGRDEMNALFGGPNHEAEEEMAAFRPSQPQNPHQRRAATSADKDVDISKLTAAETAKLLLEKKTHQSSRPTNASRYRSKTTKTLAHHQLLAEELSKQQQEQKRSSPMDADKKSQISQDSDDDESDNEFVRSRRHIQAAVVVQRKTSGDARRRRRSDSSSSSSSDDERYSKRVRPRINDRTSVRDRRRQRDSDTDNSSSDEETDRRRNRRVLASRRMDDDPEVIVPREMKTQIQGNGEKKAMHPPMKDSNATRQSRPIQKRLPPSVQNESDSEDSSSSGSTSSESSSSSSSSDDDAPVRLKPVFVPKHKRSLIQSEEKRWEEEDLRLKREEEQLQIRKAQSRALVAKELASAEMSLDNDQGDDVDDEYSGAINTPPNDNDDDSDQDKERNKWELRELERLLKSMDEAEHRRKEEEEYTRRKKLSDAECLKEDMASGRYKAPGANRVKGNTSREEHRSNGNQLKRFFHRGAFYMDESEWEKGDIREKAGEYARADTGEDKIDTSKLPEVMQVKNFGRARQNTKYKGLAKEDTTDKFARILPLRQQQKKTR